MIVYEEDLVRDADGNLRDKNGKLLEKNGSWVDNEVRLHSRKQEEEDKRSEKQEQEELTRSEEAKLNRALAKHILHKRKLKKATAKLKSKSQLAWEKITSLFSSKERA